MPDQVEITKQRYDEIKSQESKNAGLDAYEVADTAQDADDIISNMQSDGTMDMEQSNPDDVIYNYDPNTVYKTESNDVYVDNSAINGNPSNQTGFNANQYKMSGSKLTDEDYRRAAISLGVEIAVVKAVTFVESGGAGFDKQGRPKILFEAHHFGKLTGYKYNSQPDISDTTWAESKPYYKSPYDQYQRLNKASTYDKTAAQKSASWGLFQILGDNHITAGYSNVDAYVKAMFESEGKQLDAFVNFVKRNNNLSSSLKTKDWATFALNYNGKGYKENAYDTKLADAYNHFKSS